MLTRLYSVIRVVLIASAFASLAGTALAAAAPIPPPPERFLTDTAGFLSPAVRESLDARLQSFERRTGRQFLVWIAPTTGEVPIEDFAVRAFKAWGVGRKGMDDGLVLFVMSEDRRARFEVGYGLEPVFPDALASRVIHDVMAPRLQAGDADGALSATVEAVLTVLDGTGEGAAPSQGPAPRSPSRPSLGTGQKILLALVAVAFLVLFITNPSLAIYLLFNILSSGGGRMGGGGGDRGGFSGGGGRSGGGGATGSW